MVGPAPDPTIEVRRGTGHGTFGPAEPYTVAAHVSAIAAADLDQDGRPEVVIVGWPRGRVASILFNHGDGTLMAPVDLPAVDQPMDVMVSDVDGDGLPDIVVAGGSYTSSGERVAIHRGQGSRSFAPPLRLVQDGWDFDSWIAVADLNGDGHPDLAVAAGGAFIVFPGNADGTFGTAVRFPVQTGAVSIEAADLDGDRAPELVISGTATTVEHPCSR